MKMNVINKELQVGSIKVLSISGSSVFLIGDTHNMNCSSVFESSGENQELEPEDTVPSPAISINHPSSAR
ncbi:hypothetical protein XI25_26670 [Paenibacillus sp. DMB20]|nr:hypothetical protein XI25_26670 [Paenibacillus sp. DMB20]